MKQDAQMAVETGGTISALIAKFGFVKVIGLGAALAGATIMAAFRPPKTKTEVFYQGAVALVAALMFGGSFVKAADYYFSFIDLTTAALEDKIEFIVSIYGLTGALSWGIFALIAHVRDELGTLNPITIIQNAKSNKTV